MSWYSAHLVMYTMFKDGLQDTFPIREDIVLVEAEGVKEAFEKAKRRGREREGDEGGTFVYHNRAATWVFVGVRKLIECDQLEDRPRDGTEVSYTMMEVEDRVAVQKLAKGEAVTITYLE